MNIFLNKDNIDLQFFWHVLKDLFKFFSFSNDDKML